MAACPAVVAKVVLDANALLVPFEQGIRIEEELERLLGPYEALVPESVLKELAVLAATAKGQRAANAKLALSLSQRFAYRPGTASGDNAVLQLARQERAMVFTNDRALLRRSLEAGLAVVRVKGKGHLIVETGQGETR